MKLKSPTLKVLFVLFFFTVSNTYSQAKYFYRAGMCTYTLTPDTTKITAALFAQTMNSFASPLEHTRLIFAQKPSDTASISRKEVVEENRILEQRLISTEFPKSSFWDSVKKVELNELTNLSKLRVEVIDLFYKPKKTILSNKTKENIAFQKALIKGGKRLKKMWRKVHESTLTNASDSLLLNNSFTDQISSKNWEFYARMEIIRYGFYNSELKKIKRIGDYSKLEKELFNYCEKVEKQCQ